MNPNSNLRAPLTPVQRRIELDLARFLREFFRWSVSGSVEPLLVIAPSEERLAEAAQVIAQRMIGGVLVQNAQTWRAAASASLHGKRIYQALQTEMSSSVGLRVDELIAQNAKLIRRLPETLNARAQAFIGGEQRRGARASTIAAELQNKLPQLAYTQAKLLARTEVGRAETALTQARAERLGLNWYEWKTSEDQRVRVSHRKMDTVLVNWNDPPSPEALAQEKSYFGKYHPGTVFNCRCLALPLVSLDEVAWPHRVYAGGRIERVSRAQFEKWNRTAQAA